MPSTPSASAPAPAAPAQPQPGPPGGPPGALPGRHPGGQPGSAAHGAGARLLALWRHLSLETDAPQDTERAVAGALFATLTLMAALGLSVGMLVWLRPLAGLVLFGTLLAAALWGRALTRRDQVRPALQGITALCTLLALAMVLFNGQPGLAVLLLVGVLPTHAAVCGLRQAVRVALGFLLLSALLLVARTQLPGLPALPVPQRAQLGGAVLALLGVLGPQFTLFKRLVARTRELQASADRLQLALAAARQGWFDLDLARGRATLSPELAALRGDADAPAGRPLAGWFDGTHPDDLAAAQAGHAAMCASDQPCRYTLRRRLPDGGWIWVDTLGRVVERDPHGHPLRVVGVQTDITEQQAAQQALRAQHGLLEAAVQQRTAALHRQQAQLGATLAALDRCGLAVVWTDTGTGRFLYANPQAAQQLGWTVAELLQRGIADINPRFSLQALAEARDALRQGRGPLRIETRHRRRDGSLYPAEVTTYLHRDAAGPDEPAAPREWFIAFFEDITERQAAQHALQRAKAQAEAASQAKSDFLAHMSHDLRTPLAGMIGLARLVRRQGLTPEQDARMARLQRAADHLLQILNDILDLSRIEAGRLVLDEVPLRPEALLANALSIIEPGARAKGLALRSDADPLPTRVLLGDPTRLQQALLNYAGNAVKFTDRGHIALRLRHLGEDGPTHTLLRFEVSDSGIGIAPEAMARLFQRFEQADGSSTRRHAGTGLGLAITRSLAERMGGQAGAHSEPGLGSTFWFTVRLRHAPAVATSARSAGDGARGDHQPTPQPGTHPDVREEGALDAPAITSPATAAPTSPLTWPRTPPGPAPGPAADPMQALRQRHAGACVLLAEDNPVNREVATELLTEAGLRVDSAEDGLQAVAQAARGGHALVLMDIQMPGLDGLQATQQIRALPQGRRLPVIAMTANAYAEDRARCLEAGMDDFLAKPVAPQRLYATLLHWLDRGGGPAGAGRSLVPDEPCGPADPDGSQGPAPAPAMPAPTP